MPRTRLLVAVVPCLIGCGLAAQRPVVTVGGASPNFLDLPQAVAAATAGSILEVRPGIYTGFSTSKPLRILLDFTAATGLVQPPAGSAYAITVSGLPAGDEFVIQGRGAAVQAGTLGAILITATAAPVIVQGITVAAGPTRTAIDVRNVTNVVVERSSLAGTPALQIQDGVLVGNDVDWSSPVGSAVVADHALLAFVHGSFAGFEAPALRVSDCAVRLASNGSTAITVTGAPLIPVAAFEAIASLVQWQQSRFVLTPANGAPALVNLGGVVFSTDIPGLVTNAAQPGTLATMRMTVGTPMIGAVGFQRLAAQPTLFQLTGIYLSPLTAPVVAAAGVVDSVGISFQGVIPNTPTLSGEVFCFQGLVLLPSGAPVWSAPGLWTVL